MDYYRRAMIGERRSRVDAKTSHEPVHPPHRQRRSQAERQHLAIHIHAQGADRIRLEHSHHRHQGFQKAEIDTWWPII
jgi:hypothetical protein